MSIARITRSGFAAFCFGFCLFGLISISGCDDSNSGGTAGTAVQDPAEVKKREAMIQDMYKTNPPGKGPGGKLPPGKR